MDASQFDYKLLKGSHEFPGPAGGACLNEVAIVAAGLDYRAVGSSFDCPPCFSRPIADFIIAINDEASDKQRQDLKRYVMRLAGSADRRPVETQRALIFIDTMVSRRRWVRDRVRLNRALSLFRHGDLNAAMDAGFALASSRGWWPRALAALDAALAIGNQAPPIPDADALVRLGKVFAQREEAVLA